jgi:hypothetical protein
MTEDNKEAMEGTAKYVNDLPAIVEQLERCGYQTADGLHNLSMNAAFIALKEIAAKSEVGEDENGLLDALTFDSLRKKIGEHEVEDFELGRVMIAVRKIIRKELGQHDREHK